MGEVSRTQRLVAQLASHVGSAATGGERSQPARELPIPQPAPITELNSVRPPSTPRATLTFNSAPGQLQDIRFLAHHLICGGNLKQSNSKFCAQNLEILSLKELYL